MNDTNGLSLNPACWPRRWGKGGLRMSGRTWDGSGKSSARVGAFHLRARYERATRGPIIGYNAELRSSEVMGFGTEHSMNHAIQYLADAKTPQEAIQKCVERAVADIVKLKRVVEGL